MINAERKVEAAGIGQAIVPLPNTGVRGLWAHERGLAPTTH